MLFNQSIFKNRYNKNSFPFSINSEGDGTGYNDFSIIVSSDITIELVGNAKFYTDTLGNGESSTWAVTAGGVRNMFVKNTSGISEMIISDTTKITRFYFGTGTAEGLPNVPSLNANVSYLVNVVNLAIFTDNGIITGNATLLVSCIQFYIVNNYCTVSGNLSGMVNMTFLEIRGHVGAECATTVSGTVEFMTNMYNYWIVSPYNTMYGDMTNLSSTMTHFYNTSTLAHFSGNLDGLTSLTNFALEGDLHTVEGNIINNPNLNRLGLPSCRFVNYTAGYYFNFTTSYDWIINPNVGYGYTTSIVDNFIEDADNSPNVPVLIRLQGSNEPRSIASDTAYNSLISKGYTLDIKHYPYLLSIQVANATPTKVVLTFDQNLDESSVPATGDFTLSGKTITAVNVIGNIVELTVSIAFAYGVSSNLTYTLGSNKIQDEVYFLSCNSISSTAVTNSVEPVLGPELVDQSQWFNNGYWTYGFPNPSWTTNGGNSILVEAAGSVFKDGNVIFEAGKTYLVTVSYVWNSGATPRFRLPYDGTASFITAPASSQTNYQYAYTSTTAEMWMTSTNSDANFRITKLSIKEII